MPSIVDAVCNAHKKKLGLHLKNLNNQEQTQGVWRPAKFEVDEVTHQRRMLERGTWLEDNNEQPTDRITYDALDIRGVEFQSPPFLHDPANWETVTLPNGHTNHQPLPEDDPRRREPSNPSAGTWVALTSRQSVHLQSLSLIHI